MEKSQGVKYAVNVQHLVPVGDGLIRIRGENLNIVLANIQGFDGRLADAEQVLHGLDVLLEQSSCFVIVHSNQLCDDVVNKDVSVQENVVFEGTIP